LETSSHSQLVRDPGFQLVSN